MSDFVYIRRLKDGQILDIPRSHLESTLARGGFEFAGDAKISSSSEAPVIKKEEVIETFECILCGFVGKNAQALKMHKMKKHL